MLWFVLFALLFTGATARGQPADCAPDPGFTATIPLDLELNGLPGVPRGLSGYLGANVPAPPPGGFTCQVSPLPPSTDVLAGPPGDVLHGPPVRNLLRGPQPHVEVTVPGG